MTSVTPKAIHDMIKAATTPDKRLAALAVCFLLNRVLVHLIRTGKVDWSWAVQTTPVTIAGQVF